MRQLLGRRCPHGNFSDWTFPLCEAPGCGFARPFRRQVVLRCFHVLDTQERGQEQLSGTVPRYEMFVKVSRLIVISLWGAVSTKQTDLVSNVTLRASCFSHVDHVPLRPNHAVSRHGLIFPMLMKELGCLVGMLVENGWYRKRAGRQKRRTTHIFQQCVMGTVISASHGEPNLHHKQPHQVQNTGHLIVYLFGISRNRSELTRAT